jgi:hypothetical protein
VVEDAGRPVRAGQIAAAAGLSADKSTVEGLRSKLKRLAGRGWLAEEAGPGLFGPGGPQRYRGSGGTGIIAGSSSEVRRCQPRRTWQEEEPYGTVCPDRGC